MFSFLQFISVRNVVTTTRFLTLLRLPVLHLSETNLFLGIVFRVYPLIRLSTTLIGFSRGLVLHFGSWFVTRISIGETQCPSFRFFESEKNREMSGVPGRSSLSPQTEVHFRHSCPRIPTLCPITEPLLLPVTDSFIVISTLYRFVYISSSMGRNTVQEVE